MNGRGGSSAAGGGFNNFNFDFGSGSDRSRSLNDQKNSFSSSTSSQPRPSWQPNKPSWTHQPASSQSNQGGLNGPSSMVGDIFGKSWSASSGSGIGIVEKNPNLFGDLVSSALGKGSGGSNVQLKDARPATGQSNSPYSMGNVSASLPNLSGKSQVGGWGSSNGVGAHPGGSNADRVSNGMNKSSNLGGPSMKAMGSGIGGKKDPFGSLFEHGSKPAAPSNYSRHTTESKAQPKSFQNASGSICSRSKSSFDDEKPPATSQPPASDHLDDLFGASSGLSPSSTVNADDWSNGNDNGVSTTELEGLSPPPPGVSASTAKNKGMEHKNQGQYADAIKWLSWAVILLQKTGDKESTAEALSCRASCYKEVGEYKKAVTDCSKVLEDDDANVSVLVQRALLYESMEKYKLGADDLRTVLKIDPTNRIAKSTIHRLNQMA